MARKFAYQTVPDVGPYGTATNRGLPPTGYDVGGPLGGLFSQGFVPSSNPAIPPAPPSAPSDKPADPVRDAIVRELVRQANADNAGGQQPSDYGPVFDTPPAVDVAPEATPFADPEAPSKAPPDTPPNTQPNVNVVTPSQFNEIDKAYNDPQAPQNQFDLESNKSQPDDPALEDAPAKGEKADAKDDTAPTQGNLASINQQAKDLGFFGPNVATINHGPVSQLGQINPANMMNTDPNDPTNNPDSLTPSFSPDAPSPQGPTAASLAAQAGQALGVQQGVKADIGTPPDMSSVQFGPDANALAAQTGVTPAAAAVALSTPAPQAPAPPAPPGKAQGVTQDDVDAAHAIAMANELGKEDQAVTSVEATTTPASPAVAADIGQAPSPGWSTPGITAAQQADIGIAPTGPTGYAAVGPAPGDTIGMNAAAIAAQTGISAEAAQAVAEAQAATQADAVSNNTGTVSGFSISGLGPAQGINADGTVSGVNQGPVGETTDATNADGTIGGVSIGDVGGTVGAPAGDTGTAPGTSSGSSATGSTSGDSPGTTGSSSGDDGDGGDGW